MTYYLFLALAIGLGAAGFLARRRSSLAGQVMILSGCIGCAACLAWQVRQHVFTPSSKGPDRSQAVVSYMLASQVLDQAAEQSGAVMLLFPPRSVLDEESVGSYVGTFGRVLRGFPQLKVQVVTLDVPSRAAKAGRIPLSAFHQATSTSTTNVQPAVAYVSFAGVPADIEKFLPAEAQRAPGIFVFDPWGTTNWLSALKKGLISSVVVPRPGARSGSDSEISGEPQAVFNQLYLMATPATAEQVASELGKRAGGHR